LLQGLDVEEVEALAQHELSGQAQAQSALLLLGPENATVLIEIVEIARKFVYVTIIGNN